MWSDDDGPYEGRHYRLAETVCVPPPLSQPRPRVMVGGGGERKTLRLVAEYADACNLFGTDVDTLRHKLEVLDRHCADCDRDPGDIERTVLGGPDPLTDTDAFLRRAEEYAGLGVDHVHLMPPGPDPVAWVTELAERVAPRLASIG
jgi:alkanesulfonate monooxygenase SsuD/methylene tetrahydromethanopterin reductase-like flavin-dependent oxidoreductase (luciferase family)